MIDHQFEQGLVWTETPDGPEQACRVCGGLARAHGTKPAVYGRIPWPVVEEVTPAVVSKSRRRLLRRFWKWFATSRPEVDRATYQMSRMSQRGPR